MKMTMKRLWLAAVLTLCVGATASGYELTVAQSEHGQVGFSVGGTARTTAEAGEVVTITITPDEGYSADDLSVKVYASWSQAKAPRRHAPKGPVVVVNDDMTFTMPEANVDVYVTYTPTTGISTVKTDADTKDAVIYDLQGRRVMQPTKGLFIVNGKKVVIK